MTVYIDVIFLENVIMNLSIVLSEAIILNLKENIFRKVIASIVGSCFYIVHLLFFRLTYFQIIISSIIIMIAFKPSKIKMFFKEVIVFYFITFLFGGISFALMNLNNNGVIRIVKGVFIGDFNLLFVFLSIFIGGAILYFILKGKSEHVYKNIVIAVDSFTFKVNVFLDTGNLLREPYTNRPVIIVEKKALETFIGEKCGNDFASIITGRTEVPLGMFLIPYRSLGNTKGFLLGFKPKYVSMEGFKKKYTDLVIGVCEENISDNNQYSGIFGLKTLDEGVCSLWI